MSDFIIEKRNGERFIITNQKYKGKDITIKLESIIKSAFVKVQAILIETKEIFWALNHEETDDKYYIDLLLESMTYRLQIDINVLIDELVSCIQNNKMIETCKYLNKKINEVYQVAYEDYLSKGKVIYSDIPVEGICTLTSGDQSLGYATRYIIDVTRLSLLEYTGKMIAGENLKVEITTGDYLSVFNVSNNNIEILYDETYRIGYCALRGLYTDFFVTGVEKKEYVKLQVSNSNMSLRAMLDYLIDNNSIDEITRYTMSMKPKLKLANINNFMVKEYCK